MKVNEVPQDPRGLKDGSELKKVMYAIDNDGKYTGVNSKGWEAENFALHQAWADIDETLSRVEAEVREGKVSPIMYFMHKNLMDLSLLASYAGKWKWQVKRHFKPGVFKHLGARTINEYARIFNITPDELINFGKDKTIKA